MAPTCRCRPRPGRTRTCRPACSATWRPRSPTRWPTPGSSPATSPPPSTTRRSTRRRRQSFGFQTVYDERYNPVGEPTWTPFAQAIKDKGVKGLYFVGEPGNLSKLLDALSQIDYKLDWVGAAGNEYDQALHRRGRLGARHQHRVHPGGRHAVPGHPGPGHPPVRGALQEVPAERQEPGVARAQLVLGLAAVRPVGEVVRRQHHPQVRLRRRHQDHVVVRWRPLVGGLIPPASNRATASPS